MKSTLFRAESDTSARPVGRAIKCALLALTIAAATLMGNAAFSPKGGITAFEASVAYADGCDGIHPPPDLECPDPTPTPTPDPTH